MNKGEHMTNAAHKTITVGSGYWEGSRWIWVDKQETRSWKKAWAIADGYCDCDRSDWVKDNFWITGQVLILDQRKGY